MPTGSPDAAALRSARVVLAGAGWGCWRGGWRSRKLLLGEGDRWTLVSDGRRVRSWSGPREALGELWEARDQRGQAPWAVGWMGYAACAEIGEGIAVQPDEPGMPGALWLIDPEKGGEDILTTGDPGHDCRIVESLTDREFGEGVEAIRRLIAAGRVYQANLCRRFSAAPWTGGLKGLWEAASRDIVPDYMSCITWSGESPGELVCGSMELLLRRRAGEVCTRPIKGTRRRGSTEASDQLLKEDLENDPKELAELSMIVDLERNDIGKLAEPGSVVVADPGSVQTFAVVHHRVAEVTAEIDEKLSPWSLLGALAPGGSVTGCPKRAAMEIIDSLEPVSRGPFTGALGVVAGNGDAEIALPIRTAWCDAGRLEMASGCGIVWESRPDDEAKESRLKISRWLDMVAPEGP